MRPALQLLARYREGQRALFLNGQAHPGLQPQAVIQPLRHLRQGLKAPDWNDQTKYSEIHLLATPNRRETEEYLELAGRALSPDGYLYLAVENNLGADGWRKRLKPLKAESGSHSRLLKLRPEAGPGDPRQLRKVDDFVTCPGLFSWDRLDAGSFLLLQALPALRGAVADFGCGPGLFARHLEGYSQLDLIDVDSRAVAAATANCPNSRGFCLDLVHEAAPQDYDFILLNPPFHGQGAESRQLGQALVGRAVAHLKPEGQLWMVSNSHLDYRPQLESLAHQVISDERGFRIMMAEKARSSARSPRR